MACAGPWVGRACSALARGPRLPRLAEEQLDLGLRHAQRGLTGGRIPGLCPRLRSARAGVLAWPLFTRGSAEGAERGRGLTIRCRPAAQLQVALRRKQRLADELSQVATCQRSARTWASPDGSEPSSDSMRSLRSSSSGRDPRRTMRSRSSARSPAVTLRRWPARCRVRQKPKNAWTPFSGRSARRTVMASSLLAAWLACATAPRRPHRLRWRRESPASRKPPHRSPRPAARARRARAHDVVWRLL